jgi:large subunit ribosomal protein L15
MRMPKRGFANIFANDFAVVNIGRIQKAIDEGKLKSGETITSQAIREAGLVRRSRDGVRLLGDGELKAALKFEVAGATASAVEAVQKAGGSVTITFQKKVHMDKKGKPGKRVQRREKASEKRASAAH